MDYIVRCRRALHTLVRETGAHGYNFTTVVSGDVFENLLVSSDLPPETVPADGDRFMGRPLLVDRALPPDTLILRYEVHA